MYLRKGGQRGSTAVWEAVDIQWEIKWKAGLFFSVSLFVIENKFAVPFSGWVVFLASSRYPPFHVTPQSFVYPDRFCHFLRGGGWEYVLDNFVMTKFDEGKDPWKLEEIFGKFSYQIFYITNFAPNEFGSSNSPDYYHYFLRFAILQKSLNPNPNPNHLTTTSNQKVFMIKISSGAFLTTFQFLFKSRQDQFREQQTREPKGIPWVRAVGPLHACHARLQPSTNRPMWADPELSGAPLAGFQSGRFRAEPTNISTGTFLAELCDGFQLIPTQAYS